MFTLAESSAVVLIFFRIQNDTFQIIFLFFRNISMYINFEEQKSDFQPTWLEQKGNEKFSFSI